MLPPQIDFQPLRCASRHAACYFLFIRARAAISGAAADAPLSPPMLAQLPCCHADIIARRRSRRRLFADAALDDISHAALPLYFSPRTRRHAAPRRRFAGAAEMRCLFF